jgi:hypothetical protein
MAGFGRFKLTDALPPEPTRANEHQSAGSFDQSLPGGKVKGRNKGRGKSAGEKGKHSSTTGLAADQVREARESTQAKYADGSARDRMIEIGRGNQQAGRQRAK